MGPGTEENASNICTSRPNIHLNDSHGEPRTVEKLRSSGIGDTSARDMHELRPFVSRKDARDRVSGINEPQCEALIDAGRIYMGTSPLANLNDRNACTVKTLQSIPEIGDKWARMLISHRPFSSWEDVRNRVTEFGEGRCERLRAAGILVASCPLDQVDPKDTAYKRNPTAYKPYNPSTPHDGAKVCCRRDACDDDIVTDCGVRFAHISYFQVAVREPFIGSY
eukprot:1178507-Prorocentrum_minimum.AAC.6